MKKKSNLPSMLTNTKQNSNAFLLTPIASVIRISVLSLSLGLGLAIEGSHAATLLVNTNSDSSISNASNSVCTLRNAIDSMNIATLQAGCFMLNAEGFGSNDTISFNNSAILGSDVITLEQGELAILESNDITIDGSGAGSRSLTVDGNNASRVFSINSATLRLDHMTISGGSVSSEGGGIYATIDSNLTINNSAISGNSGGGIYATIDSDVTINNSIVSGNLGHGIAVTNSYSINSDSTLTIDNSTVSGNTAIGGGGGIFLYRSSSVLNNSTVSANETTSGSGGGIHVRDSGSSIILNNSTVSGNTARFEGGGVYSYEAGIVVLTNSTVSNNSSGRGGGGISVAGSIMTLNNSIVANSLGAPDCGIRGSSSSIEVSDNSIIEDGSCVSSSNQALNIDPQLGPLAYNGGPTKTHALLVDSLARDSGDLVSCTSNDQRGNLRDSGDGFCDIGAVEFVPGDELLGQSSFFVIPAANGSTVVIEL